MAISAASIEPLLLNLPSALNVTPPAAAKIRPLLRITAPLSVLMATVGVTESEEDGAEAVSAREPSKSNLFLPETTLTSLPQTPALISAARLRIRV